MSLADELQKLHQLHKAGAINDDEYALAKAKLLQGPATRGPADLEQQTRQWAMFLHFSLLAGFLLPLGGLVVPIVIWQMKKAELPGIDRHGRVVLNWILSELVYAVLCALLVFLFIGVPLLVALGVVGIVFPLIGGIKANNGEVWRYPLSISFLPDPEGGRRPSREPPGVLADVAPDRPRAVADEKCLRCGRPMPEGAAKCATCGWGYGEATEPETGTTPRRPGE